MHGQYLKNMKNNRVFLFAAVLIMSFSTPINANSPSDLIDAIMRLDDFGIIKSDIIADLTIIQADSSYIRVIAPKNFVQRMEVSVKDNLLEVSTRKTYMKGKKIKIIICSPSIYGVFNNGYGNVNIPGPIRTESFYLENKGVGNVNINNIISTSLSIKSDGIGYVNISGKVEKAKYQINGIGDLNASKCEASHVEVISNGIGNTKCHAANSIQIRSKGIGNILYWGSPATRNVIKTGVGNIVAR